MRMSRRTVLGTVPAMFGAHLLAACGSSAPSSGVTPSSPDDTDPGPSEPTDNTISAASTDPSDGARAWRMPAEENPHERTWMCWPSSAEVWGEDLRGVQDAIVEIALAIAEFEPVTMLARPSELEYLADVFADAVELIEAPVDDLWARDTLPNFVVRSTADGETELAAAHATFNGWGNK